MQEINTDELRFTYREIKHFFNLKESTKVDEEQVEQISSKSFVLDTVGTDICSFIELSNIFE